MVVNNIQIFKSFMNNKMVKYELCTFNSTLLSLDTFPPKSIVAVRTPDSNTDRIRVYVEKTWKFRRQSKTRDRAIVVPVQPSERIVLTEAETACKYTDRVRHSVCVCVCRVNRPAQSITSTPAVLPFRRTENKTYKQQWTHGRAPIVRGAPVSRIIQQTTPATESWPEIKSRLRRKRRLSYTYPDSGDSRTSLTVRLT